MSRFVDNVVTLVVIGVPALLLIGSSMGYVTFNFNPGSPEVPDTMQERIRSIQKKLGVSEILASKGGALGQG